jgi:hypothetical protein
MGMRRDATKAVHRFHQRWLRFLLTASLQTQRRVAHELFDLEMENRGYLDGEVLGLLRRHLEHAIQSIGKTGWTVQRSRRDLRGRTGRRNRRRMAVNPEVQRALNERLSKLDTAPSDGDTP